MEKRNSILKEMLIEDLLPGFVSDLLSGMESIYLTSYAVINQDPVRVQYL